MGVRPPSDDVDDEPATVEFGIAALDARLEDRDVSFPATAADIEASHGDVRVSVDPAGHEISLREALHEADSETFDSKQDLLNALHPVLERKRRKYSGSILGKLRALVPF
jgi:hypothetical protein